MKEEHHHHHHHHVHSDNLHRNKLLWVTLLNLSITLIQVVGGLLSNSLSLLSDAIHNLGDSSAIFIAFIAGKISKRQPDSKKTFGYNRVEILAALFNAVVLIAICIFLFYEAYQRFMEPMVVDAGIMLPIATFGLIANIISVLILQKDKARNLNIRAAYLHLLGDTLSSVAVIVGGIAILIYHLYWIDPLITVLVGLYIIRHTYEIIKETLDILMQSVPGGIHLDEIKKRVEQIEQIVNLHHLHVWRLDDTNLHLEAHINLKSNLSMIEMMSVKSEVEQILKSQFGFTHTTLEIGYNCCDGNDELIVINESSN